MPVNEFEMTFSAVANTPSPPLWVRIRAQGNSMRNDSVHVQFNDSVTSTGSATMQIASTSSAEIVLQNGDADTSQSGWGWADNGWNTLGPHIYFRTSGPHTLRVQQREDGAIVDQIVLSPNQYLTCPRRVRVTTTPPSSRELAASRRHHPRSSIRVADREHRGDERRQRW